jgi:hypothetical protein
MTADYRGRDLVCLWDGVRQLAFTEGCRSAAGLLRLFLVVGEGYWETPTESWSPARRGTAPGGFNKTPDMYRLLGGLLGVERRSAVAPADLPTVVHEPQGCCLQRSANP